MPPSSNTTAEIMNIVTGRSIATRGMDTLVFSLGGFAFSTLAASAARAGQLDPVAVLDRHRAGRDDPLAVGQPLEDLHALGILQPGSHRPEAGDLLIDHVHAALAVHVDGRVA